MPNWVSTPEAKSSADAARAYAARGWSVVPIPAGTKAPKLPGWQRLRITEAAVGQHFNGNPQNIGVLLGEPSGGLVDIDLDQIDAVAMADEFLPATGAMFGRAGKPCSHRLYIAQGATTHKRQSATGMIVELRSTGCQTVFPPSVHPSGEPITWHSDGAPPVIDAEELRRAVDDLADAVLRHNGIEAQAAVTVPAPIRPAPLDVTERAARYLEKIPPAVSGQGGHNRTYHAACVLVLGFALTPDQALPLLAGWNQGCQPPWSEKELLHKLTDANKQGGPRGWLLDGRGYQGEDVNLRRMLASLDGGTVQQREAAPSAQQATDKPKEPPKFTRLIDSAALLAMDIHHKYLVRGVLVAGQPGVIGGRSKTLKTSAGAIDLAISLGSGTPYLGQWPAERCRVAVWSGESGASTIRETAKRIAAARGVELSDCSVLWSFDLPHLWHVEHLDALRQTIIDQGIDVAIIDPLYLSLLSPELAGGASSLYAMGAALAPVGEIGQQTGATMIVLHHFRKTGAADPDEPAALEELAQSGVAEWARQWILLARRTPYAADGHHELWLRAGGSAGHAGLYAVDVQEGVYDPETADGGRTWDVAVRSVADVRSETRRAADDRRAQQQAERAADDRRKMVEALRRCPDGETMTTLRQMAGLNGTRAADAIRALVGECRAEMIQIKKYTRTETGYRGTEK